MRGSASMLALVLACVTAGCLPDASWKRRGPTEPEPLDDGWEIATPESVGLAPAKLEAIHDELLREDRHFATLGFLVIKRGKLVFETYLRTAADRDHVHAIQSATKSVTALAVGLAQREGHLLDLDATLVELLPEATRGIDLRKRGITLRHLLTMRSGIKADNSTFSVELLVDEPSDPLAYILDKPLYADPGERFYYRDVDPQVVSYVIERATGISEEALVRRELLRPLGIEDAYWESLVDGTTLGGVGLHLRPRDLAKLGLLLLQECTWHGRALMPADWCRAATTEHVKPKDANPLGEPRGYGYYFWTLAEDQAFAAWGHGGQFVLVVPREELVLVQVAQPDGDLHGSHLMEFVELTAPLFR